MGRVNARTVERMRALQRYLEVLVETRKRKGEAYKGIRSKAQLVGQLIRTHEVRA